MGGGRGQSGDHLLKNGRAPQCLQLGLLSNTDTRIFSQHIGELKQGKKETTPRTRGKINIELGE
jgi:hypothetical protein